MNQQLTARCPKHAGHAVNSQQHARMPDFDGILETRRPMLPNAHVHDLRNLNDLAAIIVVSDGAEENRKKQKRRPMDQYGKTGEHRRMEFLVQEPITNDVFDVIGHHREHRRDEINAEIPVMERGQVDRFPGAIVSS